MATANFFSAINMATAQPLINVATQTTTLQTPNTDVLTDGVNTVTSTGQFTYTLNNLTGGVVQSIQEATAGSTVFSLAGMNISVNANISTLQDLFQQWLSGNDTVVGSNGDDVLFGYAGNDIINGGAGTNTSGYVGASKNYVVTVSAGAPAITVQDKVGTDGTDTLTNIQKLQFTDQTINSTILTQTAALPSAQLVELVDTYIAYFNRAPDATGLDFWGSALANGVSFATIANGFAASAEATAAYPATLSNQAFVTAVYTNVLGRNTDSGGLTFWSSELQSGAVTKANFVLSVIQSVLLQTGTTDAQYIANKEAVGAHFALTQGLSDGNWAKTVMAGVNGTAASVTAANALTDSFAATAATSGGSELVMKIVGIVA